MKVFIKKNLRLLLFFPAAVVIVFTGIFFQNDLRKLLAPKPTTNYFLDKENIDHIAIIIMENKPLSKIVNNSDAAFFNQSLAQGSLLTNYFGLKNPSLENYLGLLGGETFGAKNNCIDCFFDSQTLVDLLEAKNKTWKAYMESYPGNCFLGNSGKYAQRHNPFIYFDNIRNNPSRCQKIVNLDQLTTDLSSSATTPNFIWITPDLCSDTHDCPISTGDSWLSVTVNKLQNSPAFKQKNFLLVITYDEGNVLDNRIATLVLGSNVKKDFKSSLLYDHYSLLATIENLWDLGSLGKNDAKAKSFGNIFEN